MKRSITYRRFCPDALSLNAGFPLTLLLRGALVAGVLAIIAGILGMHVLTANHAAHGTHTAAVEAAGALVAEVHATGMHAAGAAHAAGAHPRTAHAEHGHTEAAQVEAGQADQDHEAPAGATSCGGSCQSMQESGTACIPSAQAGILALFPPHQTGTVFHAFAARSGPGAAYAYTPPSPTPCDLSISRT